MCFVGVNFFLLVFRVCMMVCHVEGNLHHTTTLFSTERGMITIYCTKLVARQLNAGEITMEQAMRR
jgi:hypothetical protein